MIVEMIEPYHGTIFDPACGSGTFLFHAIRNFINEAEEAGLEENLRAEEVTLPEWTSIRSLSSSPA